MPEDELTGIGSYYDFNESWFAALSKVWAYECCGMGHHGVGPLSRWEGRRVLGRMRISIEGGGAVVWIRTKSNEIGYTGQLGAPDLNTLPPSAVA